MIGRFVLFLVVFQFVELYLLLLIAEATSLGGAIALTILTGVIGGLMARAEGIRILFKINESLANGRMPNQELLDGAFILVGGVVLITPGLITDTVGFLCLIPPTRAVMKGYAAKYLEKRAMSQRGIIIGEFRDLD